jgi:preprotein translocase subunit SecE
MKRKLRIKNIYCFLKKKKKEARQVVWGLTPEEINVPE